MSNTKTEELLLELSKLSQKFSEESLKIISEMTLKDKSISVDGVYFDYTLIKDIRANGPIQLSSTYSVRTNNGPYKVNNVSPWRY